jgi:hypothetical protein
MHALFNSSGEDQPAQKKENSKRTSGRRLSALGKAVTFAVWAAISAVSFTPTVARAEGTGNCKVQDGVCKLGGAKCLDDNKVQGVCRQIGNQCTCFTPNDGAKENQINIMYDSMIAALLFSEVKSTLGQNVACVQLGAFLSNLLGAKDRLVALGPFGFSEAKLLGKLDFILVNLPLLGSFGIVCGITVPVSEATSTLLSKKMELLSLLLGPAGVAQQEE